VGVNDGDDDDLGDSGIVFYGRWCGISARVVVVCGEAVDTVVVCNVVGVPGDDVNGVMDGEALGTDD